MAGGTGALPAGTVTFLFTDIEGSTPRWVQHPAAMRAGATYELVRDVLPPDSSLRDLGAHRHKDLTRPEQVYQLLHPDLPADFPPLKTLDTHRHSLPVQFTPFIGREREVTAVRERLLDPQTHL